jgi:hypothetical protein
VVWKKPQAASSAYGRRSREPSLAGIREGRNMKLYALAASLAVGFGMLPEASAQRGTIGAGVGDEEDFRAEGGLTIPASSGLAFLLDGAYVRGDNETDIISGAGHLISRNSGRAWGGFIGASRTDFGIGEIDAWTVGGEYARFLPRYTLAARVDYSAIDDTDADAWGLSGEYRLFAEDNLRFDFGGGLSLVDDGDDAVVLAGGAEYRFRNSPFSIGGRFGWINADDDDETSFGVTARVDFGNRTLKDRDRNGNTFGAVGSMISSILP